MDASGGREGWDDAFRVIFERSTNPISIVGEDRRIADANEAAAELLGVTRERLVGHHMREFIPADDEDDADRAIELLMRRGQQAGDRTVVRSDGQRINVEYAARRIEMPGLGRVALYVAIDSRKVAPDETVERHEPFDLTPREHDVVRLVALGRTGDEIAGELVLSPETVRTHVRNAMEKTGSRNRAQLVATAMAHRLIEV